MTNARDYFSTLTEEFGGGWTRFWFAPSDPYVLGVLRLCTGVIALWWYVSYYPDLQTWFGPDGLLSLARVEQWRGANRAYSIFDYTTTPSSLWFTYWLGLGVLIAFTAGLFSRVTSVLAFVWVVSLLWRAPMLDRPVDAVLTMVMFYLCIGPSGASWSLDRWLAKRREDSARRATPSTASTSSGLSHTALTNIGPHGSSAATVALRLMQIHLVLIYAAMALAQLRDDSWWMGRALWGSIGKPESGYIDMTWIHQYVYLLNVWTLGVVVFELSFVALIWNRLARPLLLGLSIAVWLSVGLVSGMLSFALMLIVAGLAFVPSEWLRGCCAATTKPPASL